MGVRGRKTSQRLEQRQPAYLVADEVRRAWHTQRQLRGGRGSAYVIVSWMDLESESLVMPGLMERCEILVARELDQVLQSH